MREELLPHYHLVYRLFSPAVVVLFGLGLSLLLLVFAASLGGGLGPTPETLLTAPFRWQQLPLGAV